MTIRARIDWMAIFAATLLLFAGPRSGLAQEASVKAPAIEQRMERVAGTVWIEGPGFDITYGASYERCAERCLANARCQMIEYYRPEKKCNLYGEVRAPKKGGSSDVAVRASRPTRGG